MKDGQFDHGRALAQQSTIMKVRFIRVNVKRLLRLRERKSAMKKAVYLIGKLDKGQTFFEEDMRKAEELFDKIWSTTKVGKQAGKEGVHSDQKRKGLRF